MQPRSWVLVLCCTFLFQFADAGATRSPKAVQQISGPTEMRDTAQQEMSAALRAHLSSGRGLSGQPVSAIEIEQLEALYAPDGYRSLWLDASGRPGPLVRDALALLRQAPTEGLNGDDDEVNRLARMAGALDESPQASVADVVSLDVALSHQVLAYLQHLHSGRVGPATVGFSMQVRVDHHDVPALLRAAIKSERLADAAAELTPSLALYQDLRVALARYRSLAAKETLTVLPDSPISLQPGSSYAGLRALHHQLVVLGDHPRGTPPPADGALYGGSMVTGVRQFQVRHGLEPDGIVGPKTFAALRVPLSWRIRQIELALERLRWIPHLSDSRTILVNIPMFRLWAWDSISEDHAPSFATNVIVGRALGTPTPALDGELRSLIFRPYWNVPASIVRDELLPALLQDADYFESQHLEIVSGQGDDGQRVPVTPDAVDQLRAGVLRLRQRPGSDNALGLVKFLFPNDDAVYLHDTPTRTLFSQSRRDLSHGCVRVQNPLDLAAWVLRERPDWTRQRIVSATQGVDSYRVDILDSIRVVLFYLTAAVAPDDKTVHFAEDIYDRDAALDRALAARPRSVP